MVETMLETRGGAGRGRKRWCDRPQGRLRARQLRGDGGGPRPSGGDRRALVASRGRVAAVCDGQGSISTGGKDADGSASPAAVAGLWDRIEAAYTPARADRRDGLRLDWDDRWVHIRASNTEPIVRVIAEAAEPALARELASEIGRWVANPCGEHQNEPIRMALHSRGRPPSPSSTSTAPCWRRPPRSCSRASSIAGA